ncbi:MAG: signal peptide peptidase SppA [Planctomycetes bacterium]|nr:signal peptide peptidase SppA [Planctomycetota bacterium]
MTQFLTTARLAVLSLAFVTASLSAQEATAVDKQPSTPPVLVIRLEGGYLDLPEQGADLTALLTGGGAQPKDFYEMLGRLEDLAKSESQHLLFDFSAPFSFNLAQVAELDRAIASLRKAGKTTWAYLEGAESTAYQLASQCEKVMLADLGVLDIPAPALNVTFLKDALDLIGVQFDVVRCGDFKGAVEPYVLPQMSDHLRKHYLAMVERMNASIVDRVARGRKLPASRVRELQSQRIFTAKAALDAGLVDALVPWAGAQAAMKRVTGTDDLAFEPAAKKKDKKSINPLQLLTQLFNPKEEEEESGDTVLAVLHLSGAIEDGAKPSPGTIVSGPTVAEIEKLAKDEAVKGVVVRINSPGGSATASEAILLALRDLSSKKPIVVSMGQVAASGGYYVTCFGRPILAEEGTITGSIGVFGMKPSLGALMRRIGVHSELVALDESAGMNGMDRGWSDAEKARIQGFVNQIYDVFVGHVARSRGKSADDVLAIAGGRVWSGGQAVELVLVDKIGGLDDALAMVKADAKLDGEFEVRHVPRPKSFLETLTSGMLDAKVLLPDGIAQVVAKRLDLDRALRIVVDALQNERPTLVWAMAPEALRLR